MAVRARVRGAAVRVPYLAPEAAASIRVPDVEDQGELDESQKEQRQKAAG
jgi:hypothetical protein